MVAGTFTAPALAQQATLPPALQAAVNSGNANSITQAINALSGGNPARRAQLAQQVVEAAERMLNANPRGAVVAAEAAVAAIGSATVQNSAPALANQVATTAARIFVSPAAQRVGGISPAAVSAVQAVLANPTVSSANPTAALQAANLLGNTTAGGPGGGGGAVGGAGGASGGAGTGGGSVGSFQTGQGSGSGSPDGR
ncbi:MAG TPA: hypothetical protein VGE76_19530 [Opitutaceae bacterium]